MKLTSSVFENNEVIPRKYTCEGEDISPPLSIHDIPPKTKTLAGGSADFATNTSLSLTSPTPFAWTSSTSLSGPCS